MLGDTSIPSSIEDKALEDTVLKMFRKVDVLINPSNVQDCHRLNNRIITLRVPCSQG